MKHLIYTVILLAGLVAIPNSIRADTLVCEISNQNVSNIVTFTTKDPDITKVQVSTNFAYVWYKNNIRLELSAMTFTCHNVKGNNNEAETKLVNDLITIITGGEELGQ